MMELHCIGLIQGDIEWKDFAKDELTKFLKTATNEHLQEAAGADMIDIVAADIKNFHAKHVTMNGSCKKTHAVAVMTTAATMTTTTSNSNNEDGAS